MSKKLAKLLRTEFSASLPVIAKILESKGRNRDKILAHINEDEAELLRQHGGSGTINPETGLMEFYDGGTTSYYGEAGQYTPATYTSNVPPMDYSGVGAIPGEYGVSYTPEQALNYVPSFDTSSFSSVGGPESIGQFITAPQLPAGLGGTTPATPQTAQLAPGAKDLMGTAPTPEEPGVMDRLAKYLGVEKDTLSRLGIAGVTGVSGALQARQAAAQGQQAKKELSAMARPYRERGQQMLTAAERGELTPVGQQQLQAMQARLAQGVEARGGVGVQQAQAQINAYRDQLIQAQYDLGLKILNVADSIAAGAIKTGLQADRYVNELTGNYMNNIARTLYGQAPQAVQPTPAQ